MIVAYLKRILSMEQCVGSLFESSNWFQRIIPLISLFSEILFCSLNRYMTSLQSQ